MSKPANPMAIGSFTVGALILLIVGIFIFGGREFFRRDKVDFVVFFDSSLNGLELGAPVKMQGVKVGSVTDIALRIDPKSGKVFKPVVLQIDRSSFVSVGGKSLPYTVTRQQQVQNRDGLVRAGFRARLETQSLLTGLLFVDFDIHKDKPPVYVGLDYKGLLELPAVPTTSDEIRTTVDDFAKEMRKLPLKDIVINLADSLREITDLIKSEEVKRSRVALAASLEQIQQVVAKLNHDLEPLLKKTDKTFEDTQALMQHSRAMVQEFQSEVKPVLAAALQTLSLATATLDKAQQAMGTMQDAAGPDSTLQQTLVSLRDAARSIGDLTDYLERHPESVISGKNP